MIQQIKGAVFVFTWAFFLQSGLLGVGLAMDAFSVSLANGLNEPCMRRRRMSAMVGIFAGFQFIMPMIGWFCVSAIANAFAVFERFIPWIAFALLGFIGGKMLIEGIRDKGDDPCGKPAVGFAALMLQGVATSIDALSVGFTIADYNFLQALVCGLVIAAVTFAICVAGVFIGRKAGTKLAGKAGILGGAILLAIGIKIFVTGVF